MLKIVVLKIAVLKIFVLKNKRPKFLNMWSNSPWSLSVASHCTTTDLRVVLHCTIAVFSEKASKVRVEIYERASQNRHVAKYFFYFYDIFLERNSFAIFFFRILENEIVGWNLLGTYVRTTAPFFVKMDKKCFWSKLRLFVKIPICITIFNIFVWKTKF